MNLNATFINLGSRFNAMTLRERGMIAAAMLALLVLLWDQFLMNPLHARKQKLSQEIEEVQASVAVLTETIEGRAHDNPLTLAMEQKQSLTQSLAAVDAQLESASAGLIAPQRMLAALRDVLNSQQGLRLVSMRNFPVTSLTPPPVQPSQPNLSIDNRLSIEAKPHDNKTPVPIAATGPYVHSLELIVEGSYLDVMRYLQSVEALPWRFYWQVLELKTTEYPVNRVRVRLNTISMDKEWLGV
jgi:MSHA biogenesis protein MshJ